MSQNNKIVGIIDIGTTKIVALIGSRENQNTFNILGCGLVVSKGVRRGNVINVINTVKSIQEALAIAQNQAGVTVDKVYVGIAGQNIRTLINSIVIERDKQNEPVTQEEIDSYIKKQYNIPINNDEKIIQVVPKSVILDDEKIEGIENLIGCVGKKITIRFNIVIGKQVNVQAIQISVEKAGLELLGIFLEPLASSRAVLTKEELQKSVIMIDIGGGTSDVAIYHNNMLLHTAVIPFGGNVITNDIATNFNLTFEDAEHLKKNYGSAITLANEPSKQLVIENKMKVKEPVVIDSHILTRVIQARVEEILDFIDSEIAKNEEISKNNNVEIVITGGGSMLKNIRQLIKYKLGRDVRLGIPNIYLKSVLKESFNHPQFATSVGLLMLALEDMENNEHQEEAIKATNEETVSNHEHITDNAFDNSEDDADEKKGRIGYFFDRIGKIFSDVFTNSDTEIEK